MIKALHCGKLLWGSLLIGLSGQAIAQPDVEAMSAAREKRKAVLTQRHQMNDARVRADVVRQLQAAHEQHDAALRRRAKALGLPLEGDKSGGGRFRLADFDENSLPVYEQTENLGAGISTAADLVHATPYHVTGAGVKIGLWEAGGIPRVTHQEIVGRATVYDGTTAVSSHATHVAGTLASAGIVGTTLGMAPAGILHCRNSTNATTEMTAAGAASPTSTGLFISNHSYGASAGWEGTTWHGSFVNDALTTNDFEIDFGRYAAGAVDWDGMVSNLPYYLIFTSAGNHRNDPAPATGTTWKFGTTNYTYDPTRHPKADGAYKSGYDTIEGNKLAKNVIAVGATYDGVSNGSRYPASASVTTFTCWGPADDGRIKPDLMAVGYGVLSCESTSNTATTYKDGTSMASPNACGSAALLVQYYSTRFPGGAMRASTLKGLILHTADDLGTPGPDYKTGWGLMNTKAAAEVIRRHADNDGKAAIIESTIITSNSPQTHSLAWDGATPLRVTLCWTDPAGTARSTHDNRNKALVNDLDLTVTAPDGTIHYPYVMPHVGDWTDATLGSAAVTGVNTVDNVEQVNVAPIAAGTYLVKVGHTGTLSGGSQNYSLVISGRKAAKIAVEESGPPVVVLADNSGVSDFGAAAPSQATLKRTFTIRNDGEYHLTNLGITKSGPHAADFTLSNFLTTQLVTGQRVNFTVSYDPTAPGVRSAVLHVASSDSTANPFDIHLSGTGLTEQEAWRLSNFNTIGNTGMAADDSDSDGDTLVNFMEFALATSPTAANPLPVSSGIHNGIFEYIYQRKKTALGEVTFAVVWTDDLGSGSWSSAGVTESLVSDNGTIQSVKATIPLAAGSQRFVRLQVSKE